MTGASNMYRVVAMYLDAEISEGFGYTLADAKTDAREQIPDIYPLEDVTFTTYRENM